MDSIILITVVIGIATCVIAQIRLAGAASARSLISRGSDGRALANRTETSLNIQGQKLDLFALCETIHLIDL